MAFRYDYLLSDQFLDIYIKENTLYNATQLKLDWFAYNITENTIDIHDFDRSFDADLLRIKIS